MGKARHLLLIRSISNYPVSETIPVNRSSIGSTPNHLAHKGVQHRLAGLLAALARPAHRTCENLANHLAALADRLVGRKTAIGIKVEGQDESEHSDGPLWIATRRPCCDSRRCGDDLDRAIIIEIVETDRLVVDCLAPLLARSAVITTDQTLPFALGRVIEFIAGRPIVGDTVAGPRDPAMRPPALSKLERRAAPGSRSSHRGDGTATRTGRHRGIECGRTPPHAQATRAAISAYESEQPKSRHGRGIAFMPAGQRCIRKCEGSNSWALPRLASKSR